MDLEESDDGTLEGDVHFRWQVGRSQRSLLSVSSKPCFVPQRQAGHRLRLPQPLGVQKVAPGLLGWSPDRSLLLPQGSQGKVFLVAGTSSTGNGKPGQADLILSRTQQNQLRLRARHLLQPLPPATTQEVRGPTCVLQGLKNSECLCPGAVCSLEREAGP